ncbi:hypothetical protein F6X68_33165, partial [Micromonospora sp. AMSO12t]|uniref:hypothetical protein n=1 Tax=Micromonospora sp. AMSO12t TaxID=2650410 RepID=UPI00124B36D0
ISTIADNLNPTEPTEATGATDHQHIFKDDLMQLQASDHPGMLLVSSTLTGSNYLSWNRSMKIALGTKNKLGFIDGKLEIPSENSGNFEQWKRVDCMIISWILNSISKDIVDAFLYTTSAREL